MQCPSAFIACAALAAMALAVPVGATDATTEKLPVRRVVLYKNGVGYFEHTGRVRGDQELRIDFTSSQLNDVLKSLTVLDLNGGKISGVGYNSVAPISEQLKSLRLPLGESTTLADFLGALRGSRVEVSNGSSTTSGRLLSVEEKVVKRGTDANPEETRALQISVITDAGEVRSFQLGAGIGVRIADHDLTEEITRYLNLVSSARDQDVRRMTIATSGSGDRNVFVSYISEVPIWKSTYRFLLPDKPGAPSLLQGWAIVDNTVGEDWKDVELSLVAGSPQSFIQELSKPYYTRRPVVGLPETAMLTPQTHEGTMEDEEKVAADKPAAPPPPPAPSSAAGLAVGGPQTRQFDRLESFAQLHGKAGGVISTMEASAAPINLADAAERQQAGANGQDLGDLFEYNLKEKVSILKNHSALVPIVNAHVDAEKVTLWSNSSPRPLRALWVKNTSGLTLDSGAFNIIENNAFAGEGLIEHLKPEEKRLLSYAVDQGVRVEHQDIQEYRPITRIKVLRGVMIETREQRDHQSYTIHNSDADARDIVIEHPVRPGWKLINNTKPEESSASYYRFRVKAGANQTQVFKVDEVQSLDSTVALTNLTDDQIKILVNETHIKPELEQALRKIMQQKNEIAGFERQIKAHESQINGIGQDQQRLRENMKALKGSLEERALVQRYTRELNEQEDKLQTVRSEIQNLEQQRNKSREQLDAMLQTLTLDEGV
ncbi:MAG TPA: hypothetical protein VKZ53_18045 [Candidatus Angelobacter sp.]|nr:hypothetical protein [Candidatus Angelobacter sp.]